MYCGIFIFPWAGNVHISGLRNDKKSKLYQLLNGFRDLTTAKKHGFPAPGVRSDYFATPKSKGLNELFTATGLKEMLELKDYANMDMVFLFMVTLLERVLGDVYNSRVIRVHALILEIVIIVVSNTPSWELQ